MRDMRQPQHTVAFRYPWNYTLRNLISQVNPGSLLWMKTDPEILPITLSLQNELVWGNGEGKTIK